MKKWFILSLICISSLMLLASIAFAQPQSNPNGPWIEDNQNVSLSSVMTNAELYKTLEKIQSVSKGRMTLEIAGYSDALNGDLMEEAGYPLYVAKFGQADPDKKRVLITSQIHGNEVLGTEAAVELMQQLAAGGNQVDEILDNVSIWFMPRINPDGAMHQSDGQWHPIRQCSQLWDPKAIGLPEGTNAPWYYNSRYEGYDENRDYNPNLDFRVDNYPAEEVAAFLNDRTVNNSVYGGFYVTPEARIVTKVFKEMDP
ncbi:Zinc carboxypeptidase [Desulfotomaculum arcticum]|uniref:Zinc carboxypeptidase n=1 Tax=Desulfotruncus arcticus DSM 17038 TaxID=1121424 RepID=A0A1I2YKJ2_9FIRM|nr:M14 family zinc carboxypeptidase [Desulfotruncus arcticus]SFH26060.1 Zinc carboxypeptidase [Desulfotomaculum arcticum] [Desulfotruncus arcticus DSM 17038]